RAESRAGSPIRRRYCRVTADRRDPPAPEPAPSDQPRPGTTIAARPQPRQEALAPAPASPDRPQREPLNRALEGDAEPKQMRDRPEHPKRKFEQAGGHRDRASAQQFEDRAGLAPFGGGKLGQAAEILRLLGELQPLDRGASAGLALHSAEVAGRAGKILYPFEPRGAQKT